MVELIAIVALGAINFLAFLFLFYKWRFPPLYNIVLAKATYDSLSPERKAQVKAHALAIVNRSWRGGGFTESNFDNEPHRFGWYALAMAEIGIPPLQNNLGDGWHYVKRPHRYPLKGGSIYEDIVARLKKESGINVSIAFPLPRPTSHPRQGISALDAIRDVGGKAIVEACHTLARDGRIPNLVNTSDERILEIYGQVVSSFRKASEHRGERLSAGVLNNIFLHQVVGNEQFGQEYADDHLQYEIKKYLAEGLREDYKQEVRFF